MKIYKKINSTSTIQQVFMNRDNVNLDLAIFVDILFPEPILMSNKHIIHATPEEYHHYQDVYQYVVGVVDSVIKKHSKEFFLVKPVEPSTANVTLQYKDENGNKVTAKDTSSSDYFTLFAKKDRCLMSQWAISLRNSTHTDYHSTDTNGNRVKKVNDTVNGNNPENFNIGRTYDKDDILEYSIKVHASYRLDDNDFRLSTSKLSTGSESFTAGEDPSGFIEKYLLDMWRICDEKCVEFYYRGLDIIKKSESEFCVKDNDFPAASSLVELVNKIDNVLGELSSDEKPIYTSCRLSATQEMSDADIIFNIVDMAVSQLNDMCYDGAVFRCVNVYFRANYGLLCVDIIDNEFLTPVEVHIKLQDLYDVDYQKYLAIRIVDEVTYSYDNLDKFDFDKFNLD